MNSRHKRPLEIIERELKGQDVYTGTIFTLLRRLWRDYLSKRKGRLAVALIATVIGAGIHLCFPMTIRFLFDHVLIGSDLNDPHVLRHRIHLTWVYLLFNCSIWAISLSCQWIRGSGILSIGQWLVFNLRKDLNEKLHNLHIGFFERTPAGRIMSRLLDDVDMIRNWITGQLVEFVSGLTRLTIGIILAFYINWKIALVVLMVIPFYAGAIYWFRPRVRRANITMRRINSSMYARASERIGGIPVVRAFTREKKELRGFASIVHDYVRVGSRMVVYNQGMGLVAGSISAAATALVIFLAALSIRAHTMSLGDLVAMQRLLGHMFDPIQQLTTIFIQFQAILVVLNRVFNLLDEKVDIPQGGREITKVDWPIVFDRVSLAYPGQNDRAVEDISLTIGKGEHLAIMGPSGSGKSTLFQVLLRFYDPSAGRITLGMQDLKELDAGSLRRRISMVQQEPFIFSGTIRTNIRYGHLDATDDQVQKAARLAQLDDFIMTLPKGYDTEVGEKGISLSGGQKQRLALATALLTDPEVLLLDDITSSLDAETEAAILRTILQALDGRTSLFITQRIVLARGCDRIIVLDDGKIESVGTHEDLISREGFYRTICEKQGWRHNS
jgi:ABC-type multidrug transport system fused ATPase/permease subunit